MDKEAHLKDHAQFFHQMDKDQRNTANDLTKTKTQLVQTLRSSGWRFLDEASRRRTNNDLSVNGVDIDSKPPLTIDKKWVLKLVLLVNVDLNLFIIGNQ